MDIPPLKHFAQRDRLYVQAQQIWLILVGFVMYGCDRGAGRPPTITYGDVAIKMGYEDGRAGRTLSRQLGIINSYCVQNEVPVLNSIVVMQSTGLPATELSLGYEDDGLVEPETALQRLMKEQRAVMDYDWFSVRVPTTGTFRKVWESLNAEADQ